MRTVFASVLAVLSASLIGAQHHEPADHDHMPPATHAAVPSQPADGLGRLAGAAPINFHVHGASCTSDADLELLQQGIADYIERFGPLSQPTEGGQWPPFPVYPSGGVEWDDLIVANYVDLDPDPEDIQDWKCGTATYDGHQGIDALIMSFAHQAIGVPVIAVLDGTVVQAHDGEPDHNTEWLGQLSNQVCIDHGEGRYCWYLHMKRGSVLVEVGQEVRAGEQIGMVASSGNSNWPHLHFATYVPGEADGAWDTVEPYAGDCNPGESGWVNQISPPVSTQCMDFGVTLDNLNDFYAAGEFQWRAPTDGYVPLDHDGVWMWATSLNIPGWSTCTFRFYDPTGNLHYDSGWFWLNFSPFNYLRFITWYHWDIPGLHTTPGTWTVEVLVNSEPHINFPMDVVGPSDPAPNRPPESVSAVIRPWEASADDLLTCRLYTAAPLDDRDWDLVRYDYTWSIGGRVVREVVSVGLADHLPRLEGCDGAVVQCLVVPSDGIASGEPTTARIRISGESNGDPNCDGSVNVYDLLIVLNDWGSCDVCSGDLNGDGETGIYDLLILLDNWG